MTKLIPIARPQIGEDEKKAVADVLDSGMLADGPVVREFEKEFAGFCGTKYAIATSSGTTALHAALLAMGVGPGDEVITTPFSFFATASSIRFCGATPVFVDIEPDTFNLDPSRIEERITPRTKAIMPVHLYGLPADMTAINDVAARHDLMVIEDSCQAHGALYRGKRAGSLGNAASFSFYPTKNMTTGEGGMVTTDDEGLHDKIRLLVNHGQSSRYSHAMLGFNYRMTSIAAAIGRVQLKRLPGFIGKRRKNASMLDHELESVEDVTIPAVAGETEHVYHQYTVRCRDRDAIIENLKSSGVGYGIYYPSLLYETGVFEDRAVDCPVAERFKEQVLSLPVHPGLDEDDIGTVATAVRKTGK